MSRWIRWTNRHHCRRTWSNEYAMCVLEANGSLPMLLVRNMRPRGPFLSLNSDTINGTSSHTQSDRIAGRVLNLNEAY